MYEAVAVGFSDIVVAEGRTAITSGGRGLKPCPPTAGTATMERAALDAEASGVAAAGDGGLQTTAHGAERIAGDAATRGGVLNEAEVIAARAGSTLTQADGAIVRVLETAAGRFNVVVEGERGIVTTFKNLSQKSLDRLAKNYGWK